MTLIADCGSTKCEWYLLTGEGKKRISTQGISPYFLDTPAITQLLEEELLPHIQDHHTIGDVFYYGTGCTGPETVDIVSNALRAVFGRAAVQVTYDLVAAAHALCGDEKGIPCILGTGCNSGYYNGKEIERNSPGLGYALGDEGSGAYLGIMVVRKYLYGDLEDELKTKFEERFGETAESILYNVYSRPLANRYLASFSIFLSENRGHPVVEKILAEGLGDFFSVHIRSYAQCREVPVHFVGSIAYGYRDVLQTLGAQYGFQIGRIFKQPMDGLLEYYMKKK